jgi:small subunit ribosomal protein S3
MFVSTIDFERDRKSTRVILNTSRPGLVIGRSGEGVAKIKADIAKFMRRHDIVMPQDFKIDIVEIANPDADAMIIAQTIADGIRRRMPYRRLMKQAIEKVMGLKGIYGCRLWVSGLIGGSATMKRREQLKRGSVPLQFIRADIDYAYLPMKGKGIGIKVWVNRGDSLAAVTSKKAVTPAAK